MSFSTLIFCPFSAFLKCDRENEEHVYADLLDVCSSNDQSSGRLWNILDFFIFVFNPSIFSFLRRRSQTDGVLRHLEYQTHMPLVSRVFCLLCGFVTPKRNTQQSSGTRRISIGVAGGGGGRGDKGYRIHMTCYTLGSRWMHDSLRANLLAGYREKFLFLCPSLLHRSLSSYLFTRFDLHSKWRSSTFFQFSNYCWRLLAGNSVEMRELKQSEEKPILLVSNPYVTDSSLSSSKPLPFRPDQNNDHNVVGQGDVSLVLENPGGQESQSESFLRVKDDFVHQQESSEETEVESDRHQHQHRYEDAVDGESFVIDFPSGGGFSL